MSQTKKTHDWWVKADNHCIECGKLIHPSAKRCFICSHINLRHYKTEEERREMKRSHSQKYDNAHQTYCPICDKPIARRSAFCIEHRKKPFIGSQSPNWRGGKIPYNGEWKEARRIARETAKGICQRCGKLEIDNSRKLDTHHIQEIRRFLIPEASHNSKNLICLCRKCHAQTHHPKGSPFSSDLALAS